MTLKMMAACAVTAGIAAAVGFAQPEGKPPQPAAKAPAFNVEGLAFLKGAWVGEMDGGRAEEMWSGPSGNNLVGAFRWLTSSGNPIMFEVLTITAEDDGVYLRMHHYNARLRGKEAADKPITCKMGAATLTRAEFANVGADHLDKVIYEVKEGVLAVEVTFKDDPESLKFKLRKQ